MLRFIARTGAPNFIISISFRAGISWQPPPAWEAVADGAPAADAAPEAAGLRLQLASAPPRALAAEVAPRRAWLPVLAEAAVAWA